MSIAFNLSPSALFKTEFFSEEMDHYMNDLDDHIINLIEKLNYKEGKKDGECTYFYTNGKLLQTENWKMGVKDGEQKTFLNLE